MSVLDAPNLRSDREVALPARAANDAVLIIGERHVFLRQETLKPSAANRAPLSSID